MFVEMHDEQKDSLLHQIQMLKVLKVMHVRGYDISGIDFEIEWGEVNYVLETIFEIICYLIFGHDNIETECWVAQDLQKEKDVDIWYPDEDMSVTCMYLDHPEITEYIKHSDTIKELFGILGPLTDYMHYYSDYELHTYTIVDGKLTLVYTDCMFFDASSLDILENVLSFCKKENQKRRDLFECSEQLQFSF